MHMMILKKSEVTVLFKLIVLILPSTVGDNSYAIPLVYLLFLIFLE